MNEMRLVNVEMLYLLWMIPVLAGVLIYSAYMRQRAIELFIGAGLMHRINVAVSPVRRRLKAILLLCAVVCVILALTRPGWNPKPETIERRGRDVVFVLDVSRSMLSEDLAPNRIERAKLAILDCVERLKGDRVALVAFAGSAAVKCPLTLDYGFFRMMLEDISPDSISRGGTMIGDAIRKTLADVFDDREKECKDIILITDGEDHDSFPVDAAKLAGERGVRIIAIGLGSASEGQRIPITDEQGKRTFLKHKGQEVWSKLDADTLAKMVNATPGGKYYNVGTGAMDLGDVYMKLVAASNEKKALESKTITRYEEKFQVFLAVGILLLLIETVIGDRRRAPGIRRETGASR